jgi:hypothetical protein
MPDGVGKATRLDKSRHVEVAAQKLDQADAQDFMIVGDQNRSFEPAFCAAPRPHGLLFPFLCLGCSGHCRRKASRQNQLSLCDVDIFLIGTAWPVDIG